MRGRVPNSIGTWALVGALAGVIGMGVMAMAFWAANALVTGAATEVMEAAQR